MYIVDVMNTCRMGRYYDRTEKAMFAPYLPQHPVNVLDLGGGTGRWSDWVAGQGHNSLLLDRDMHALKIARSRHPNIQSAEANVERIPAPAETFEVVIAVQMFEMIADRSGFFQDIWRVLKPGGVLFLTWGNRRSMKGALYGLYARARGYSESDREFFYKHTHAENDVLLRDCGFEVLAQRGYAWTLLPRNHDTRLVDGFVALENGLRLYERLAVSPNVITVARKRV